MGWASEICEDVTGCKSCQTCNSVNGDDCSQCTKQLFEGEDFTCMDCKTMTECWDDDIATGEGTWAELADEAGLYPPGLPFNAKAGCAAMHGAAEELCRSDNTSKTCAICGDKQFCDYKAATNNSGYDCCASCIPTIIKSDPIRKAKYQMSPVSYQTGTWEQFSNCIEKGACTEAQLALFDESSNEEYARIQKRLIACDPQGTTKWIELLSRNGTKEYGGTKEYVVGTQENFDPRFDQLAMVENVSALGKCDVTMDGADLENSAQRACFQMYEYGLTLTTDMQVPSALEQAEVVLNDTYHKVTEQAANAVNFGFRVQEAGKSLISLLPITLAVLPGLAKGAKKAKYIVPQATLVGFLLYAVPVLQLPTMAAVFCILIQVAGTWYVWLAIMCFVAASVCPILGLQNGFGPHRDRHVYIRSKKWHLWGMEIAQQTLQGPLVLLAVAFILINFSAEAEQAEMMGLDDLKGTLSKKAVTAIKALFNFFKGKTFTVLMSADLLMQMMIFLEGYTLIHKDLMSVYKKRMVGGLLLSVEQKDVDFINKFDVDGDGQFNDDEIEQIMQHVFKDKLDRMKLNEDREDEQLTKKEMKKTSKKAVAPVQEGGGTEGEGA